MLWNNRKSNERIRKEKEIKFKEKFLFICEEIHSNKGVLPKVERATIVNILDELQNVLTYFKISTEIKEKSLKFKLDNNLSNSLEKEQLVDFYISTKEYVDKLISLNILGAEKIIKPLNLMLEYLEKFSKEYFDITLRLNDKNMLVFSY